VVGGFVRLPRQITEHPVWTALEPPVLKVMLALVIKANWTAKPWYDGSKTVDIPRGSFVTSYPKMAEYCQLSPKQVRSAFAHLEKLGIAAYKRAHRWTMVTVLDYDTYQPPRNEEGRLEGSLRAGSGQDEGTMRAPTKEVKNIRTPPTPSEEGAGVEPPVESSPPANTGKRRRSATVLKPYQSVLEEVSESIYARHPRGNRRRDASVGCVATKLASILKHKRTPADECEAYLRRIDRIHEAMCASDEWCKDDGRFAKSLRNFLAPTEEFYDVEPESDPAGKPRRLML
jgi:hypothetical protein